MKRSRRAGTVGWLGAVAGVIAVWSLSSLGSAWAEPVESVAGLTAAVSSFLLAQVPAAQRQDAEIRVGRIDPRLQLPACGQPLGLRLGSGRPASGPVTVQVRCAGARPWSLYVPARVVLSGPVVVMSRPVARGEAIEAADLRLVQRDRTALPQGYYDRIEDASGLIARQSLAGGQILVPGAVDKPKAVRRGDQVILQVSSGGLEVRAAGECLADGAVGERVRVRNPDSRRVMEGVVVAAGVVQVAI